MRGWHLVTGYARNPSAREKAHNAGRGARYTRGRRPVAIVYLEPFDTRSGALKREHQLKRWSRDRKAALADLKIRRTPDQTSRAYHGKKG